MSVIFFVIFCMEVGKWCGGCLYLWLFLGKYENKRIFKKGKNVEDSYYSKFCELKGRYL